MLAAAEKPETGHMSSATLKQEKKESHYAKRGSSGIWRRYEPAGDSGCSAGCRITNARVAGVISNNKKAYALTRAEQAGIPARCVSPKDLKTGERLTAL